MNEKLCPDCKSPMEAGYTLDASYMWVGQAMWKRGKPSSGFMGGLCSGPPPLKVFADRCTACGLLKMYAPSKPPKRDLPTLPTHEGAKSTTSGKFHFPTSYLEGG